MKLITNRIRGTRDLLPEEYVKTQVIINTIKSEAELYGFNVRISGCVYHNQSSCMVWLH